jgi:hypothetical protein
MSSWLRLAMEGEALMAGGKSLELSSTGVIR